MTIVICEQHIFIVQATDVYSVHHNHKEYWQPTHLECKTGRLAEPSIYVVVKSNWQVFEPKNTCGLYYKCFMMVIYNRNDRGQYYKTAVMIVIDNRNWQS